jgi:hypothetical protein
MREYRQLCCQIEDAGSDEVEPLLARWNARAGVPYTHSEFKTYYGAVDCETFVAGMLLGAPALVADLTYDELREVLRAVLAHELSEAVDSYYLNWLEANLPDADVTGLIYCTSDWFGDLALLHAELSPDQLLAYALARSGRHVPGAPAGVPMPYPLPTN